MGAGEGVLVDEASDAGERTFFHILPEMPAPVAITLGREGLHAAQPEGVVVERPFEDVAVEIDAGIDDRALAVMVLELIEELSSAA